MVFLEKNKKGRIYWYATERKMVNGVVKRTWQKYPGTAEKIVEMKKKSEGMPHIRLKSFQYGKTAALPAVSDELNFVETVNKHTNKKKTFGLTVGEYLLLNIIGRCDGALSEHAMQKWFRKSTLNIMCRLCMKLTKETHNSKISPRLLDTLIERLSNLKITTENLILVFDKGNNSEVNIEDVLSEMHTVASAKHEQARDLLRIPSKGCVLGDGLSGVTGFLGAGVVFDVWGCMMILR